MANQQSGKKFALVRTDDSKLDVTRIARLLAGELGLSVMDSLQLLSQRPGILAENLPEEIANRCAFLVAEAGVQARVVPQSAVLEVPEIVTLRSGRLDDDGFLYIVDARRYGVVKWPDVLWVDFVTIQEFQKQGYTDVEVDEGEPLVSKHPLATKFPLFLDLVTYEPWLLLRISDERFEFTTTGLPTFTARRDNLIALSAAIAERATKAHLGRGLKWLDSGSPRQPQRVASTVIYSGFLRWQLTRLFLN
ncbi:MAG TPA: hypothetical protein VGP76_03510 [Planctomycetaceae bacterium]|nr:hypothetical protein [Planctomycetaceae bacterium]